MHCTLAFKAWWCDHTWFFRRTAKNLVTYATSWSLTLSPVTRPRHFFSDFFILKWTINYLNLTFLVGQDNILVIIQFITRFFSPFLPVLQIVLFIWWAQKNIFDVEIVHNLNFFGKIPSCELNMKFLNYAMATVTSICLHGVFDCFPNTFTKEVNLQLPWLNLAFSWNYF